MKILISGSTGLVGSDLVSFLTTSGHEVIKLVRTRANLKPNEVAWNLDRGIISPESLEGLDAVVHLAGENLSGRWTEEKKKLIQDSRVKGTEILCQTLAGLQKPPKVLISASAIGYYGNRGSEVLTEQSTKGTGFLADVCERWEAATQPAVEKGIRVVNLRIGMVLSPKGGGLQQMLIPFKIGLGGKIGNGDQYMSWIALEDLIQIIYFALQKDSLKGPVNAVSPNPVTNEEFTKVLGHVLQRPTFLTMPDFATRWVFGELADALLLASTRVQPEVLKREGFKFNYPTLIEALKFILGKSV